MSVKAGQGAPPPQGDYVPAKRHGALIFTSGMTPRRDGVLQLTGPVKADAPLETWRDAVVLAAGNALVAARSVLAKDETIGSVLSLTVYIAAEPGFTAHAKLADYASEFLRAELGENGVGTRAAVGVATLPGGAPVEVQVIFSL